MRSYYTKFEAQMALFNSKFKGIRQMDVARIFLGLIWYTDILGTIFVTFVGHQRERNNWITYSGLIEIWEGIFFPINWKPKISLFLISLLKFSPLSLITFLSSLSCVWIQFSRSLLAIFTRRQLEVINFFITTILIVKRIHKVMYFETSIYNKFYIDFYFIY